MQFFFDNLTASIVGGVVLMILAGIQLRGQRDAVDAGQFYASRVQTLSLIDMIERDFPNVGAGVASGPKIVGYSWSGSNRYVEFNAVVDTTAGAPVEQIRYRVVPSQSAICSRAGVACFEVQRHVIVDGTYQLSGRSPATITDFEVALYPEGASFHDAREVRVRLAALSQAGPDGAVSSSHWRRSYRPVNLLR